ncbi:hypothetical protein H6G97_40085 [Nostoc flagelliforme FACHB-838]|uniref:Transposase n=1 Tax=Nostoc flagelliforme FACHB-838 TaxID=2692904 RepID=A0ABR8E0K9_9NOSO|nr:hypothetical protein [Nostoc flagelliforme]MBD2535277.1 hypothetical protein [Nostoc flagelliforme FACHB-838]
MKSAINFTMSAGFIFKATLVWTGYTHQPLMRSRQVFLEAVLNFEQIY